MLWLISFTVACIMVLLLGVVLLKNTRQLQKTQQDLQLAESNYLNSLSIQSLLSLGLVESKAALSHNLLTDALTNLPSRGVFEDRLQLTINQSERYHLTFGIIFLNLDGFKVINDALGHDVGDILLKEVATRLMTCIRQVDTVSRFVGDEFVFILPQLSKAETVAYVAQRTLNAISQPFEIQGQELYITASIGVAVYPADGTDVKTLLKNAATALHQAKSRGRNTYQFYRTEMHAVSQRELILSSSLRSDLIYQDFSIYYQPQVNVESKEIICMETLLRWQHPDFGLITFSEFSRLAENCGKIAVIEEWLLRNALRHLLKWKNSSFNPASIAIPISLKQLENTHLVQKISTILQEMETSPELLVLEIAETSLVARIEQVEKMLYMLKHLGVQISINNFGSGHLSLQHLRRLPIDSLRLMLNLFVTLLLTKRAQQL